MIMIVTIFFLEQNKTPAFHSGTLLSNKIRISLKINFRVEETVETNLSASLNQPHKAFRKTTKPKKHFISQQGGGQEDRPCH